MDDDADGTVLVRVQMWNESPHCLLVVKH